MANPVRTVILTGVGVTPPIPLDNRQVPFNIGLRVTMTGAPTTPSFRPEYTFDDIQSPTFNPATADWSAMSAMTTSTDTLLTTPCTAVRLNLVSLVGGTIGLVMTVVQAGAPGR